MMSNEVEILLPSMRPAIDAQLVGLEKYVELSWVITRLHKYGAIGRAPNEAEWMDWLDQYSYWSGVAYILGNDQVRQDVDRFTSILDEVGPKLMDAARAEDWRSAYTPYQDRFESARRTLLRDMQPATLDQSPLERYQ